MAFAVDLHTHTRHGSNCSYMEPKALLQRARELGLSAVCITEHNAPWEPQALAALDGGASPRLFPGLEVSTQWGDVLVFGGDDSLLQAKGLAELRRRVDAAGGVMIAAHPFRRYSLPGVAFDLEEACQSPLLTMVEAAEVFNGMASGRELEVAQAVLSRLGLRGVGGSDSHAPHTLGCCYTRFERPLESVQALVAELKAGRFRAVHAGLGLTF